MEAVPDVMAHAAAYAVLISAMLRGLAGGRRAGVTARGALFAAALAGAYWAADEFYQPLRFWPQPGVVRCGGGCAGSNCRRCPGMGVEHVSCHSHRMPSGLGV